MNVHFHHGPDSSIALYIDGNLQFDSRDEAVYHESLALPALCMASSPKSALICGGGDGLALREILRFPGIERVTLVDCSPEVIEIGRTTLRELNAGAFDDSRVTVVIADALEHPLEAGAFDVILCDFTFPTTKESAQGFTVEWYHKLAQALSEQGVMAINGVSPQNTASAFACLVSSIRAAGLKALPYHVCIPSFRDHGYGAWGFILASRRQLTITELKNLACPVETRQTDMTKLWRGARFPAKARREFASTPPNFADKPCLQALLLNPERPVDPARPPDFPNLMRAIEIQHPYHSRSMIETLAEQVAESLHSIDLRKLVEELHKRAARLPDLIRQELTILREFLSRTVLDLDLWGMWASRLLAALLIVMTLANSISPDPAFAKGASGMGHASFSRGFTSHESTSSFSSAQDAAGGRAFVSGSGFRNGYGSGPVDLYGQRYHSSPFYYGYHSYYPYGYGYHRSYYGNRDTSRKNIDNKFQPIQHQPLFLLDDDLMVMDNGDMVVTLSPDAFLLVAEGKISLVNSKSGEPLMPIYAEPKLFTSIRDEVATQQKDLGHEIGVRRDWMSWVGWTKGMFPSVKADSAELGNMVDLNKKLGLASQRLGATPEKNSLTAPTDATELFVGCQLLADNRVVLYGPGGKATYADAVNNNLTSDEKTPMPPEIKTLIVSVMKKLLAENQKDVDSFQKEFQALATDEAGSMKDLQEYQSIQSQNPGDPDYEVDYGTSSVPVSQAVQLTQKDLDDIRRDRTQLQADHDKQVREIDRLQAALRTWGG